MNRFLCWILLAAILVQRGLSLPTITEAPDDEDEDLDDEDDSSEADDDGRVYKNPRNSPSTECPRDEEQATLLGQKCLRKCSSDEDCKSKKKKCLCDGACGMSCIKPDRECPELQQPSLGTVTLSGRHFGGRASYTCPHGYHVVGLQSRLCQADGQWAGAEPACKKNIYCLTPPVIEHARHSALPEQATFDLDSTVQYHCHTGYVTNGFPRAKCLAIDGQASWYGPDIQCEPRSCGQPLDPSNGWHAGECYSFGCRIIYHCGEGYELVGKPERYCQADGSWIPKELPNCVLVTSVICPIPDFPPNGKSVYTTVSYNSVVSYECRYGFTLIGESSRRCGADKKWTGSLPTCKEINCGDPGVLYNGWLENIQAGTGLGASLIFRCQPEMLMIGPSSAICLGDGRWSHPMPECLAPCIVPTISQGQVVPIEPEIDVNATTMMAPVVTSVGKVRHGTSLEVICNEYYEFPSSALGPPTCNNGTWSVIPRCVPARCKHMPKVPKNSMVLAPKTDHGMKARFKCKDGYILTGSNGKPVTNNNDYILTCSFGNWTGDTPQCLEVYCGYPGSIPHGKVFLVGNMGLYDYRPYVKKIANNKQIMYDCDKGYVLDDGPQGATCVGGMWRPYERPRCIRGEHPRLRWNRRRRSIEMRHLRSTFLLNEQRHLQKWLSGNDSWDSRHPSSRQVMNDNRQPKNVSRPRRETTEIDRAYSKYYQRIKEKYKNYIKNLLGYNSGRSETSGSSTDEMHNPTKKVQVQDGRWYNSIKNVDYFSKYRPTHKTRIVSNQLLDGDAVDYEDIIKDSLNFPSGESEIFHGNKNNYRKGASQLEPYDNFRSINLGLKSQRYYLSDNLRDLFNSRNLSESSTHKNLTSLIEHLKSQIIRRKRGTLEERAEQRNRPVRESTTETTVEQENAGERRGKGRVSCEELNIKEFANVTVVRPGKGPGQYSAGVMLHIVCHPGFKLNSKNPNATAKCVRGIWKPQKPACLAAPCSVPSTEHGKYFEISPDSLTSGSKPNLRLLTPYEEVGNGLFASFQCEDGYGVQGPSQFRCVSGNWSISTFPECLPLPCTLPTIPNIIYEGGYRSGLTIAHGSSVSVHCDNPVNSLPIQMVCSRGSMSPATIHCETGARKSREEYLGEAEFIGGENPLNSLSTGNGNAEAYENGTFSGATSNANESMRFLNGGRDCGNPNKIEGALVYKNTVVEDDEEGYPTGTEILFNCIASVGGERNTWKIVCEDGNWVGRSYICANGTCLFKNNEPNVVSFYNDLEIREDIVEFPPGATIISRCIDIGKYALIGSSERSCIHSEWSGQKPTCFGLNQENDYAMEKPPTILFRHQNGPIAQSNDGKLIVYPGTTVHMECLWMRRFGNPKWNVSHEYRNYPEGWVTEDGRDPQLEYRLSIFHAVEDDSGVFTCQTPARHEHSVEVLVKAINCPDIPIRRGLVISNNDTKMSSRILLSCANGNSLIGASELFCLPSGNWSAPLPVCESVECGDIPLPINESTPRVAVLSREVGGRAAFSCPSGFGLRGPSESICLPSGEWGTPFPKCVEVQCDNPGAPQNGYAQGSAPYRAGDVVQFNCNPEYMMQGQPIIACQDNGRWSGGLPKCVQACSYPGTVISGRMSLVKFYYAIGESITFTCDAGLELKGTKMLRCLRNGKWSHAIPTCANTEQINRSSVVIG